jgi:hypothetical protein
MLQNFLRKMDNTITWETNLGNLSEREETTKYAKKTIRSFIKKNEHHLALLIAHIYAGIRLRSLLTDSINPRENKKKEGWKNIAEIFHSLRIPFLARLKACRKLNKVTKDQFNSLGKLNTERNKVAHESEMWKGGLSEDRKKEITNICESVIEFLEQTNY